MENRVANIGGGPEQAFSQPNQRPAAPEAEIAARQAESQALTDLRLVIEQDADSGSYVYKTVDRRTGEIVQQLPRDQILRMHEGSDYAAGGVIRAKA